MDIDAEIKAKGLTAPRVTPDDIRAEVVDAFYFTAAQGIAGSHAIPANSIDLPASVSLLTFCVLVLRNGFTVTGESACASPENFDAELGQKIARQKAEEKIWALLGFRLRDKLSAT